LKRASGPTVLPQQPAYLLSYFQRILLSLAASIHHGLKLQLDAPLEAIVHGLRVGCGRASEVSAGYVIEQ
jgi:hypothetical protein